MERQAPAKLNRFLAVLGRRADGFHELELVTTVLDSVPELRDTLTVAPAPRLRLTLDGPTAQGLDPEDNLVLRAWRSVEEAVGRALPAHLHLTKRIPHGAGLGGGSSDAAAALLLARDWGSLPLSLDALLNLACALGSDVPLFLLGGTVLGLGRGERVFALHGAPPLPPMILVHPGLHVPTPKVFQALATVGYPPVAPTPSLGQDARWPWRNDLTQAALHVCPALATVQQSLVQVGATPLLCGSGSSWVGQFDTLEARDQAMEGLQKSHPDWKFWQI